MTNSQAAMQEGIDSVVLDFSPVSTLVLSIVLALIMFGIALDTTPADFRVVARQPRLFLFAVVAQIVLLPAVTFVLTLVLPVSASMALGMIVVAASPPGNVSQVLTHRAGGNVALSVVMTAISVPIYILLMPLLIPFWASLHPTASKLLSDFTVNPWRMLLEVMVIIGVPFVLGFLVRMRWTQFAQKVKMFVRAAGLLTLLGFVVVLIAMNWQQLIAYAAVVLIVVIVHDTIAFAIGYGTAVFIRLGTPERKAFTYEVGVRNSVLALGVVLTFFDGLGGAALVAAWWGIWDILAGLMLASLWSRHTKKIA